MSLRSRHTLGIAIAFVAIISSLIFGVKCANHFVTGNKQMAPDPVTVQPAPPVLPDPFSLNTFPLRGSEKSHLLDGNFNIVTRMSDITEGCRESFESSFVNFSGAAVYPGQIPFADPGQDFQAISAIREGLPFRRLVLAGLGSTTCFVYYERGGAIYSSSCLAIVDYNQKKTIWVGESNKKAWSFKALRSIFEDGSFQDTAGPAC